MRGRRLTAIMTTALLALVAAGCGGSESLAPEVPGPPADVALPEATVAAAAGEGEEAAAGDEDATTDEGTTEDGAAAPEDTAPADPGAAAPETEEGGTAAPEAPADGPTNDTAPPEGSEAEQFEDFCAQNPGAC